MKIFSPAFDSLYPLHCAVLLAMSAPPTRLEANIESALTAQHRSEIPVLNSSCHLTVGSWQTHQYTESRLAFQQWITILQPKGMIDFLLSRIFYDDFTMRKAQVMTSLAELFTTFHLSQNSWIGPHPMRAVTTRLHCPVPDSLQVPSREVLFRPFLFW